MSDERLAEIHQEIDLGTGVLSEKTALELLAEVERLRAREDSLIRSRAECERGIAQLASRVADAEAEVQRRRTELDEVKAERDEAEARLDSEASEVRQLASRARAVRQLHPRERRGGRPVCGACLDSYEEPLAWPCPTMAALDATEAGS